MEETDVILLWGSNARETHPIFFHHVLKAVRRGARLYVIDPRRTASAAWADGWLPLHVGSDIALANGVGRVILERGLEDRAFVERATTGFAAYRASLAAYPRERVERETGVPDALVERMALDYARADRAMICWTLGITEHHNAVNNVLGLINLALLTGHVGRWGSGLNPLRGQNNVQGGGDMGALPNKLTGFQDVEDDEARGRFERAWGAPIPPKNGWNLTQMFEAMDHGELTALFVIGENPAQSEADAGRTLARLRGLECLVVQDIFRTATAELADVVLPASASFCESEGTVTNSERRVQRVRRSMRPPGSARDDIAILADLARRMGQGPRRADAGPALGRAAHPEPDARRDELSPPRRERRAPVALRGRGRSRLALPPRAGSGRTRCAARARPSPWSITRPPPRRWTPRFPLRLTTGRRLDSYNTGVQSGGFSSPLRRSEALELRPEDAARFGVHDGEVVRVSSRRGSVVAPVRFDPSLPAGLVFMTMHFPDEVDVNQLTIDAVDPKSGTAEFKAAAVRIDKLSTPVASE